MPDTLGTTIPKSALEWLRIWTSDIKRTRAFVQFQYVDVTFNATANADTDIVHALAPPTPTDVDYEVVRLRLAAAPGTVPVIYEDTGANRRAWGNGYMVLRANVGGLAATLRLTVRAVNP